MRFAGIDAVKGKGKVDGQLLGCNEERTRCVSWRQPTICQGLRVGGWRLGSVDAQSATTAEAMSAGLLWRDTMANDSELSEEWIEAIQRTSSCSPS